MAQGARNTPILHGGASQYAEYYHNTPILQYSNIPQYSNISMLQYSNTPIISSEIATPNGTYFIPAPSLIQLNAWVDDEAAWELSKAAICRSRLLLTASSRRGLLGSGQLFSGDVESVICLQIHVVRVKYDPRAKRHRKPVISEK